jgi:hypothetical protein
MNSSAYLSHTHRKIPERIKSKITTRTMKCKKKLGVYLGHGGFLRQEI